MKIHTKAFAVTLCALLLTLAPAMVGARTIYFLVGVRHIYRIGPDRDLFLPQREEIEKTYADGVAADEATYQQHVSGGADAAAEAQSRDQDLDLLADDRDKSLGAIFDLRDDIRASHPDLQIQGDGPYQVMGIDYHMNNNVMVFDDYSVYAPWPGYVVVGQPYGGWVYGRVYQPGIFFNLYLGWHRNYVSLGAPVFYGGFYGHTGYIPFRAGVFVGGPTVYRTFVRPGGTYFARSGGFNHINRGGSNRPGGNPNSAGWNRSGSRSNTGSFGRPGGNPRGSNRPANGGGYSHGHGGANPAAGQSRGGVQRPSSGGYSHSGAGSNRSGGAGTFNRSTGANRNSGGSRSGSFGGSSSTGSSRPSNSGSRPSGGGGYSHSHSGSGSSGSAGRPSSGSGHSGSGHSGSGHNSSGGGHGSNDHKGHGN